MSPAPVKWGDSDKRIKAPEAFIMFLREVLGLEDAEPKPYPDPADQIEIGRCPARCRDSISGIISSTKAVSCDLSRFNDRIRSIKCF